MSSHINSCHSRRWRLALIGVASALFAGNAWVNSSAGQGKPLPDGPGKEETRKLCSGCHELDRSIAPRQDLAGWQQTMNKMVAFGMKATERETSAALEYLVRTSPRGSAQDQREQSEGHRTGKRIVAQTFAAAAIIQYRDKHGDFKSIEDLKKVPGVDFAKIEAKKDRLTFQK